MYLLKIYGLLYTHKVGYIEAKTLSSTRPLFSLELATIFRKNFQQTYRSTGVLRGAVSDSVNQK